MDPQWIAVWVALGGSLGAAEALARPEFAGQVIELPRKAPGWFLVAWADADGDGRPDLLVLDPAERALRVYSQRDAGFSPQPDQTIDLPPDAAWVRVCDVAPDPGPELVISAGSGLRYLVRDHGRFGSAPRTLLEAAQVFSGELRPRILEGGAGGRDRLLPVCLLDRTEFYEVDGQYRCRLAETVALEPRSSIGERRGWSGWSLNSEASRVLEVRTRHADRSRDLRSDLERAENRGIRAALEKLLEDGFLERNRGIERGDLDGDGREDLVLWSIAIDLPPKTTVSVYIRAPDGRLPESPDKVLRCQGIPAFRDEEGNAVVIRDVDGDRRPEIVLAALRTNILSVTQLADAFISQGIDWDLTIRSFRAERGSGDRPDARIPITACLTPEEDMVCLDGDLDGDGRKDLAVRRSSTDLEVFPGRERGYFAGEPAFKLRCPVEGHARFREVNGDGVSDVIVTDYEHGKIGLLLSGGPREGRR